MRPSLDDYQIVDEEKIRNLAATNAPGNQYYKLLEVAQQWRDAGCTPVIIVAHTADDRVVFGCVAEETFGKYLN